MKSCTVVDCIIHQTDCSHPACYDIFDGSNGNQCAEVQRTDYEYSSYTGFEVMLNDAQFWKRS